MQSMNATLKTIHALRSIHGNFSERSIAQADLEQILEASIQAANASARQSYAIIVLDDREAMQRLFYYQGSHALIFCIDFNRIMATAEHLGHQFSDYHIIGFITAAVDTILAAQTAVIAAKSLGIDSLITNGLHRNDLDTVYRELNLPEEACFPLITLVLGYPNQEPPYKKGRLSSEFLVHFGQYHSANEDQLDRIAAEYDDHTKHVGLMDNWEELDLSAIWTGSTPNGRAQRRRPRSPRAKSWNLKNACRKAAFGGRWPKEHTIKNIGVQNHAKRRSYQRSTSASQ